MATGQVPTVSHTPWYRKKWFIITLSIVGSLIVLAVAVAAIIYTSWLASPERALTEATRYALERPASYKVTGDGIDLTIHNDGTRQQLSGTYTDIPFEAVIDKNMIYVKSSAPEKLIDMFGLVDYYPGRIITVVDSVIPTIKNKWVSMSTDELSSGGEAQSVDCSTSMHSQLQSNPDAPRQLTRAYVSNRFITTDTTTKSGDEVTYDIVIDSRKLPEFLNAFQKTKLYESLASRCDKVLEQARTIDVQNIQLRTTINTQHMRFATMSLQTAPAANPTNVLVSYDQVSTVLVPQDAISFNELQGVVAQSLFNSFLQSR